MNKDKRRKLAAIMFCDIQGYTSLMQTNEQEALTKLNRFKSVLENQVSKSNGKIANFYGDGCLAVFDSSVDAMSCAKNLQMTFRENPAVPVRIGLHSGGVVFEEGNAYGDAVNIASRVESLGIPGAVLLSSAIRNQIKNVPEFQLTSLGRFEFKNVEDGMTVYALANEGFPIPKREEMKGKLKTKSNSNRLIFGLLGILLIAFAGFWFFKKDNMFLVGDEFPNASTPLSKEIRQKRVAVMIFENKTGNENFEDFGTMISDWITKGLMETGEANVISAANIQHQIAKAGIGVKASQKIAVETGVGILLQGRYYLQENDLIIHSNIVDADKGEVIYALDPIQGSREDMLKLLDELTQKVLGYWAVKSEKRYLQNPPKYEAYQKFMEADKIWGDDAHSEKTEKLLIEAYQLDTSFYPSLLKLAVHYGNPGTEGLIQKRDSVFQLIEDLNPSFTKWEKLRYEAIQTLFNNNYLHAAQLNEQMYRMDASDQSSCYNSGYNYIRANMPIKALEILTSFDPRFRDLEEEFSWFEMRLAEGYFMTGEYEKVIETAKNYPFPKLIRTIAKLHLRSLVRMDSIKAIQIAFEEYDKKGVYDFGGEKKESIGLIYSICQEAYLSDKKDILIEYVDRFRTWTEENREGDNYANNMPWVHYFLGDIKEALTLWEKIEVDPQRNNRYVKYLSRTGVCHALLGNTKKAEERLALVENGDFREIRKLFNMAKIQAALGRNEEAVNSLKKAHEAGLPFVPEYWTTYTMLKPLFGDAAFVELMKPKG